VNGLKKIKYKVIRNSISGTSFKSCDLELTKIDACRTLGHLKDCQQIWSSGRQ